jgi:hypothetical protein
MDNLIEEYILSHYSLELQTELFRAFHYFNEYNYVDHELPYINLLMAEDLNETQELQDQFFHIVYSQQETIFKAHLLTISNQATLFQRNEILEAFLQIQNLHDYSPVASLLDSTKDRVHATALVIEKLSSLTELQALDILLDIDPLSFTQLKNFVNKQMLLRNSTTRTYTEVGQKIVKNMRDFISFTKNKNLLGRILMDDGVLLNQPLPRYKSYFKNSILNDKDLKDTALQILSVLYLEEKGIDRPLESFREYAALFFSDLNTISQIEHQINHVVSEYTTFLKVRDEKERLLQASHYSS